MLRRRLAVGVAAAMSAAATLVLPATGVVATQAVPEITENVPATAMDVAAGLASNSPAIAADPTELLFVAMANRVDAPDFGCALQLSGNGGRGWAPTQPVRSLPPGVEKCYAPEVAFDGNGTLYFLFVGLAGEGNRPTGAYLTASRDRGRSFTEPRQVLGPLNFGVRMAIDPAAGRLGRIHLVWLHATSDVAFGGFGPPPNPIMSAFSDDGGHTFSPAVQVSDQNRERAVAPALALGSGGSVHVAYYDLLDDAVDYQGLEGPTWDGSWALVVARSTDGGRHFSPGVTVDDAVTPFERVMLVFTMPPPALAAGTTSDRLCVAWPDERFGDADVLTSCSSNGGRAWRPPSRVNDDPRANGARQFLPRLGLSPRGRLDVVFYDRRDDPSNVRNDVFYAYSTDDGGTFGTNVKLTAEPSDSRIGQQYLVPSAQGQHEFGSRLALLSRADDVVAAWADTRNSVERTTGQDVFTTEVRFATGGSSSTGPSLAGGVAVLGGALAASVLLVRRRRRRPNPSTSAATSVRMGAAVAVALVTLVPSACRSSETREAALPAPPPIVDVAMSEYRFEYEPNVAAGRVVFRFHNAGHLDHDVDLVPLPEDYPPIEEQVEGSARRVVSPFGQLAPHPPGSTATFAVDLVPGRRYALLCSIRDADGETHTKKGMVSEFRAGGRLLVAPAPEPAGS